MDGITYVNNNPIDEFENQLITAIGFGSQNTNTESVLEYTLTLGIRNIKGDRRDLWEVPDQYGGYETIVLINEVNKNKLFVGFSFKIGIFWEPKK